MTLVYRLAKPSRWNQLGDGPFRALGCGRINEWLEQAGDYVSAWGDWYHSQPTFPNASEEVGPDSGCKPCAVEDWPVFREWFPPSLIPHLGQLGYEVLAIEVDPPGIYRGKQGRQCCFEPAAVSKVIRYRIEVLASEQPPQENS